MAYIASAIGMKKKLTLLPIVGQPLPRASKGAYLRNVQV